MKQKNRINKRFWLSLKNHQPELEEEMHVYGARIGKHIAKWDGKSWLKIYTDFDSSKITHFHYFPGFPKRTNK